MTLYRRAVECCQVKRPQDVTSRRLFPIIGLLFLRLALDFPKRSPDRANVIR